MGHAVLDKITVHLLEGSEIVVAGAPQLVNINDKILNCFIFHSLFLILVCFALGAGPHRSKWYLLTKKKDYEMMLLNV